MPTRGGRRGVCPRPPALGAQIAQDKAAAETPWGGGGGRPGVPERGVPGGGGRREREANKGGGRTSAAAIRAEERGAGGDPGGERTSAAPAGRAARAGSAARAEEPGAGSPGGAARPGIRAEEAPGGRKAAARAADWTRARRTAPAGVPGCGSGLPPPRPVRAPRSRQGTRSSSSSRGAGDLSLPDPVGGAAAREAPPAQKEASVPSPGLAPPASPPAPAPHPRSHLPPGRCLPAVTAPSAAGSSRGRFRRPRPRGDRASPPRGPPRGAALPRFYFRSRRGCGGVDAERTGRRGPRVRARDAASRASPPGPDLRGRRGKGPRGWPAPEVTPSRSGAAAPLPGVPLWLPPSPGSSPPPPVPLAAAAAGSEPKFLATARARPARLPPRRPALASARPFESRVAQGGFRFPVELRMTSNSRSCSLPSSVLGSQPSTFITLIIKVCF
ncbi:collagen alpha-1(I) chain-like [Meriones unguiculatus]|uniref:collagen alpha-1(I) chain-like n=1 Tax=Meriones unguiculatus TaxID=10047 RepID=UPI00293EA321|nr:collagen alpha-1(I) chain-like [Meriones unguiculatus]